MTFENLLEIYEHIHAEAEQKELELNRARKDLEARGKEMYRAENKADYDTALKAAEEAKETTQRLRRQFDQCRRMIDNIMSAELR